jgi:hypothetical protein
MLQMVTGSWQGAVRVLDIEGQFADPFVVYVD